MNYPKGNVTFLCTTPQKLIAEHRTMLRKTIKQHQGILVHDTNERMVAVFSAIIPTLTAALELQTSLEQAGIVGDQRLSIAIHSGQANERNGNYSGETLNRAYSILEALHPGQIVLSAASQHAIVEYLPATITLRNLGSHRLNDLLPAMELCQVIAPNLPSEFPSLKTLDQHTHNLPILLTPLIGREDEVQALSTLLTDPDTRLVTLLGSSGAGKTRLALQVAVEQITTFADGVFVVSLAPVTDPNLVLAEIAHTLQIKEQGSQSLIDTLLERLATQHSLIVLDNFEQLITAAPLLQQILEATTRLKFFVTSQIACEIPQEHIFHLPPLTLPEKTNTLSIDALTQIPAVALFIERTRDVQPNFTLNATNAEAVVELCSHLGGLPLAIELVAAQSKRYFPNDMLLLLKRHLLMAKATGRSNSRKDILYPVLDWICEVLGSNVAGFFARLGVFAGGCTPESAAICNPNNELGIEVLPTLNLLLDNHLLLREELKASQVRYTMLDAVHEYAQQRLNKRRETPTFQKLHANYYVTLVEDAEPRLLGQQQADWQSRLDQTHHNLRAALQWLAVNNHELLIRLSGSLTQFWFQYARYTEGREWLELALSFISEAEPQYQAKIYAGLAYMGRGKGEYDFSIQQYEKALDIQHKLGNISAETALLNCLGTVHSMKGEVEVPIRYYTKGIALGQTIPEPSYMDIVSIGSMLANLGVTYYYEADFDKARTYFQEAHDLRKPINNPLSMAFSYNNLGLADYQTGHYDSAKANLTESLKLSRELHSEVLKNDTLGNLAKVYIVEGDLDQARLLLAEALAFRERQGNLLDLGLTMETYAQLALAEGNPARAVRLSTLAFNVMSQVSDITPLARLHQKTIEDGARPLLSEEEFATAKAVPTMEFAEIIAYTRSRE